VSLDKGASSDPNLNAVHAGASMRKTRHLQPKASEIADAEVSCFAFSRLAAHIRVLSKGKAHFASKTIILKTSTIQMVCCVECVECGDLRRFFG
jgi:hypothetical protein